MCLLCPNLNFYKGEPILKKFYTKTSSFSFLFFLKGKEDDGAIFIAYINTMA